MLKNYFFTIFFIGWVVLITWLSLFSFSGLDTGSVSIPYADKVTHLVFYGGFVVLGCLFIRELKSRKIACNGAIAIMLPSAVIYGIFIEFLQYTITENRMAEYGDAIANTIGAGLGALLIWWYFSKKQPLKWKI
ncbi:VanZ family protein [Flagellimonas allohymeniacidonis]|uniref:VanZ family protein n=1 Tax=Flagellimonas allohymeniacidonis TaxID=2517819 RepID=UPI0013EE74E4|nr:VanZ family protein [Allomuricauda hymeniacidonis]